MSLRWIALIGLALAAIPQADDGAALLQAARIGDLDAVRALLDAGTPIESADRYGSTAIAFAARAGHGEVVALLLERGADPNVVDSFYGMTPVGRALMEEHLDVARLLLQGGATENVQAVLAAASAGDLELMRAALAAGPISTPVRDRAVAAAGEGGHEAVVEALAAASIDDEVSATQPPVELDATVGLYRDVASDLLVEVTRSGDALLVRVGETEPRRLERAGARAFRGADDPGLAVSFFGRGGSVEFVQLRDGEQTAGLQPLDPEEAALLTGAAAAPVVAPGADPGTPAASPHWPQFRGPDASGVADGHGVPTRWDVATGEGIAWSTPIPGIANSSPVVWGDHVFVTTAVSDSDTSVRTGLYGDTAPVEDLSSHQFKLYALDRRTGSVRWERTVHEGPPQVKRHPKSSQANSSPVTDGKVVVVLFGSVGKLAAYDFDGEPVWEHDVGVLDSGWFYDPDYQWGHAASPILYEGTVIVQADVQEAPFIAAYDLATGRQVWRTERHEIPTFSSPALYRGRPRDELITNGPTIRGYDPGTGRELWSLGPNSEVIVGTPVVGEGVVYVTGGYPPVRPIYAIRPGGDGDISLPEGGDSNESVLWSKDRGGTYIPTPLLYRGLLYTANNDGRLTAYDAASGDMVYRARIGGGGGSFVASPVASDGHLYFAGEEGDVVVVKAGPEYVEVGRNEMNEVIWATPAITPGMLVLRTLGHVYGIGS